MAGVIVVYLGLITVFAGIVSVLKPLKFLAIHSRGQALIVIVAGLLVVIIGSSLPARETRIATPRTQLDQFTPAWQFSERHSIRIAGPKEKVYVALKQVTADEIHFFRTLIALRASRPREHPQSAARHATTAGCHQNNLHCSGGRAEPGICLWYADRCAARLASQRQQDS